VIGPQPPSQPSVAGWANPNQRLEVKAHEGVTHQQQGILFFRNLAGTPYPVHGCTARNGQLWRVLRDYSVDNELIAGVLDWESDTGEVLKDLTQAQAVERIGPEANWVYNPMVNGKADMGIATPDGWVRMFPDRADF
jgi:hypothetical protein